MVIHDNDVLESIKEVYGRSLGINQRFLVVGGSLGRGNKVEGWSDVDLLLVLRDINRDVLQAVRDAEHKLAHLYNTEIDTMIVSENTLLHTPAKFLHGKVKNFLFHMSECKILFQASDLITPQMSLEDFRFGFWTTLVEQEKNFYRRNTDVSSDNIPALRKLLKKNIKIIFLLLKQSVAGVEETPTAWEDIRRLAERFLDRESLETLDRYVSWRTDNSFANIPDKDIIPEIDHSIVIFDRIERTLLEKESRIHI